MLPASFDPAVAQWFEREFPSPTPCQVEAWAAIAERRHTLVAAPTGSGKTLAAFLHAVSDLAAHVRQGTLAHATSVLYVSPLKALSNDVERNLARPLAAIEALLADELGTVSKITTAVRTGDTPASARVLMRKQPPHILVTTPESLYILLTSDSGRAVLASVRTVIIDEIHALVGNKRGAHLALSLARLERVTGQAPLRIGLSATQRPIERVAEFLCGDARQCAIVDQGHVRARDIAIEMPPSPLETVLAAEVAGEIRARMIELIRAHRTTLVFVNTRRMAERLARALADELGEAQVCAHHGSMSRERRLDAEQRLKAGRLSVLVATASLELGIDIGDIELVCQLGTTRSLAALLQRIGRAGHVVGGIARGRLFPQTRDELIEAIALLDMLARDELDSIEVPEGTLDVLAQQIVAEVASQECELGDLFARFRTAWPYRLLTRAQFDEVVGMLAQGFSFAHGRRSAYLHLDAVNGRMRARRGAKLTAVTCGGAIPDTADYDVIAEPSGERVGTVNEDFAIESLPGNIFQLGNTSWRVLRVEPAGMRVEDAAGEPPNIPFWLGEAPARSTELSASVAALRARAAAAIEDGAGSAPELAARIFNLPGVDGVAAGQAAEYLLAGYRALGAMPTQDTLVMERFFDESGGMQLVIHAPFGSRLNKAWGLALRKRFCRTFNFELQAAAVEDAIVLSLGACHSFALDEVWRYLNRDTVRDVLSQSVLTAPMFGVRWRWVATCALAIERFQAGRKVAPRLIRMRADDLSALVFPDQLACAENLAGRRDIPDHPLVKQALSDCLHEAMDVRALEQLLGAIAAGHKQLVARDLTEPSPFALQVLNANPYAFLDDAPLEERRTQAVQARRWLDPSVAQDLGALDVAALTQVRNEAWPQPRSADELHEAVLLLGMVTADEAAAFEPQDAAADLFGHSRGLEDLEHAGRVVRVRGPRAAWVATERWRELASLWPHAHWVLMPAAHNYDAPAPASREDALASLVRSRLEASGPTTAAILADLFACGVRDIESALARLEQAGIVLRGRYTPGCGTQEWCDRRLLARIHRLTMGRLRREIEAVPSAVFVRFLLQWQSVTARVEGSEGLARVLAQLAGFQAPYASWHEVILPARVHGYDANMLDLLLRTGRFVWLRLLPKQSKAARPAGTLRTTLVTFVPRAELYAWLALSGRDDGCAIGGTAAAVLQRLESLGAAFFDDLWAPLGLLRSQLEDALDELAAAGRVTCDSVIGLRALIAPNPRRASASRHPRSGPTLADAGRWARLPRPSTTPPEADDPAIEVAARATLRRYGVVCRSLVENDAALPPWRVLVRCLRRLEARGEVRGGRFIAGLTGEQYALPQAVNALRETARQGDDAGFVRLSASDPLNLFDRLAGAVPSGAQGGTALLLQGGEIIASKHETDVRFHRPLDVATTLRARTALLAGDVLTRGAMQRRRRG